MTSLIENERDNAAEKAGTGTTFRENGKERAAVHSYSEHRIVTPTIQIRTLKGCGLTQGKSPEYPCKNIKHKNVDDIFEQGKQQKSAYKSTLIRRRKRKTKALFGSVRTVSIRVYPSTLQRENTKSKTATGVLEAARNALLGSFRLSGMRKVRAFCT